MVNAVQSILQSLGELSKRKVKRSARIWTTRIEELVSRRELITSKQAVDIAKLLVQNQLESHRKVHELTCHIAQVVPTLERIETSDIYPLCYLLAAVDLDDVLYRLLDRHLHLSKEQCIHTPHDFCGIIKSVALMSSRHKWRMKQTGYITGDIPSFTEIVENTIHEANKKIPSYLHKSDTESQTLGEIIAQKAFIEYIWHKNTEVVNAHVINGATIGARVRIAQMLTPEAQSLLQNQIAAGSYQSTLSTLREIQRMRYPQECYLRDLYARLCATTGASTYMCRQEAIDTLDHFINMLKDTTQSSLLDYLKGIRRTDILASKHQATHRWNYPINIRKI
ncbi:hypothetical protein BBOV_III010110 [Babesia bovis T2Bo]|uniref:Uncharacterized protein n=1 Tax=Babesia bovis TaxID=5865 RepID=A7APT3_BABBO|nr:hypothetical protein BBOV_III010110 [Babesia bovis T2Bo]EDO08567.1 hypothetical protein BBOV_III010110 [Babesia bovis T2Bo]|eukprot:XP_001612135.1 hypothetical protein [Babesia bovis T2Bo]